MESVSEPRQVVIKPNLRLILPVLGLLIVLVLVWSDRVWMILLVALGVVWFLEFMWARSLARGLGFKRELRYGWAQVGDLLEERFTLSNTSRLPALWVQVTDHSNLPGYDANVATGVQGESENVWRNSYVSARRGAFHLGPTTIATGTPFGMYTIEFQYAASGSVIIMPPVVPLPEIIVAPGGRAYEGRRRASTFERTVSVSGVRDYVHGDPFKTIHWRTAAHANELMVRTFDSTPAGDWWIWLDLDRNDTSGAEENSMLEHSIILAASLVERGLRAGRAVGLVANGRELVWLAPQAGEFQRLQILRALATVEPGAQSLASQIPTLAQVVDRHASIIFITCELKAEWLGPLLSLRSGATQPTVILLDPVSYGRGASTTEMTSLLAQWGISHFVFTRELMEQPETQPGHQGHWDWRVGATGRAIAHAAPSDQEWRPVL